MNRHPIAMAILLGCVLGGLAGCRQGAGDPGIKTTPPSKIVLQRNVDLTTALQKSLVYRVETIGVLEAEGQTDIAAGVNGVVDEVFFREGDDVRAGDVLVTIDKERYQADEELARANMDRAKESVGVLRDIAVRAEKSGSGISTEEKAKAIGNYRVAEAEYRSNVAAHARARHNLARSRVKAPYDGRINKRLVTIGTYLEEKTVIATIADLSRMRLVGYVAESAAPVVRDMLASQDDRLLAARVGLMMAGAAGQTAWQQAAPLSLLQADIVSTGFDPEFEVFAMPGQVHLARIFYMSTVGNADTHMFECKAEVLGWRASYIAPNFTDKKSPTQKKAGNGDIVPAGGFTDKKAPKDEKKLDIPVPPTLAPKRSLDIFSAPKLWPGFTAKIRFPMKSSPNAVVVPEESVRYTEKGVIAFVPEEVRKSDGSTEWLARARVLDIGFRGEGWVEVRRGLSAGERLVHRGAEALEDGTPIRFKN
ncbi:MAG: efflux RND transporter periplasmic adaptor subunit [Planctomycetes bacterium]|nr:efflux RND transporter periplasmic adaptor subunit [Planctomycetota bacterium]